MAEEENAKEGQEGDAPKSKKKLFIILGIVLLLVGAGVPAAFLMMGEEPEPEIVEEDLEDEIRLESFELEPIIVNLSKSSSFLKATIVVEYDLGILESSTVENDPAAARVPVVPGEVPAALASRVHHMKDAIIANLSAKTADEVLSPSGKDRLKDQVVEALNDATALDEGPIVAIYFLEFIVQ